MPFDLQTTHPSPTGALLNLYLTRAGKPARGVIQINHGLAEHAGRYDRFAASMAECGFHVYAHDHRGHGATTAPDAPRGMFGTPRGAAEVVADVGAVHDLIARQHPGLPVIVFGHSMGGLIAMNFVLAHSARVAGAAVWNANFTAGLAGRAARALLALERFRLGSDVPSRLLPELTFRAWAKAVPNRRTEFDWLSRDHSAVSAYVADPLCGWDASVSMWRDVFGFMAAGADDRNFATVRRDLPFNLVGGEDDPATGGGRSVLHLAGRLRRMGFSDLTAEVYAGTRHESLKELNNDVITKDFARWAMYACRLRPL